MLKRFSVENYKSFEKKITLDLTKSHDYNFNKEAVNSNGIIKDAVIFGHNGCGKSNLGFALFDIVLTLTDRNVDIKQLDHGSFLNFDSPKNFSTISYDFLFNHNH